MAKKANVRRRRRGNWYEAGGSLRALLVILAPRFSISQHAVGLVERFHLILAAAPVGMAPRSHALVQSLEVSLRRALVRAEDGVVIFLRIKLAHVCAILDLPVLYLQYSVASGQRLVISDRLGFLILATDHWPLPTVLCDGSHGLVRFT